MRGRCRVIAVKQSIELYPEADVVYGCDAPWWQHRSGLPKFAGMKICWSGNGLNGFPDIRRIEIAPGPKSDTYSERLSFDAGTIGGGGNSGFQALNLAVQFGAKRILLIGFDMQDRSGLHWYGRNTWLNANNPNHQNFRKWIAAFEGAKDDLARLGVVVINTSSISDLRAFPRRSIEDMLNEWGA